MSSPRLLHTCSATFKHVVPSNLKGKGSSSAKWLTRQLSDPYVEKAKMMNYRCRSAFKLIEIDDRHKFLQPGKVVVDCGAAPGSWTQVAVQRVNADGMLQGKPKGVVISVDKQQIFPISGAVILGNADFTQTSTQDKVKMLLDGKQIDVVISDMAPNSTGIKEMDNEIITDLCYFVLRFAVLMCKVDAVLLVKLWQSNYREKLEKDMLRFYHSVKVVKPNSSRSDSSEIFLIAKNFKGLKVI